MKKDRVELESALKKVIEEQIQHDKGKINKIKDNLMSYNILPDIVQIAISHPDRLNELDLSVLMLLTEEVYKLTGNDNILPQNYFTDIEIKKAHQYQGEIEQDTLEFPLVLNDVLALGNEDYITVMDIKDIVKLYKSNLLQYNFETQRNSKWKRKKDQIIQVPNINPKSVKEITEHILNNTFLPDTITFNCLAGTSETGDELIYDYQKRQLIINECELDILDGFHRINAFQNAVDINPDIEFKVQVAIKNYNVRKAQAYVAQINTINKMDSTHLKALKADRYSDFVVKELQRDSDLKGRIAQANYLTPTAGHIVTYGVLADTIDEVFKFDTKKDAMDVAQYLIKFFDYLIGSFPDEFINYVDKTKKVSLINNNNMFAGFVVLAKKMKEMDLPLNKLPDILNKIDFNKDNPLWVKIGVLDKDGKMRDNARKKIRDYFLKLDLNNLIEVR